jgi:hypothetical protein
MKVTKQRDFPSFLRGVVDQEVYFRWLARKANAHVLRDRKHGNATVMRLQYHQAIHEAVKASNGLDAYTGKPLDWTIISKFDNESAKAGKREYRKKFENLPTVDHVGDRLGAPKFKICSQQTNDCKSNLSYEELVQFCRNVIAYHENLAGGSGQP